MFERIRRIIIGTPIPTAQRGERQLNKIQALATFSPDALSSIAYANQEIYLGLIVAGSAGLLLAWPIGLAITAVLFVVALSYYQTIHGYPSGGGSYIVARENLGMLPGLIAAAALLVDYLLTAAVSLTAGVDAIASAFPLLLPYRIPLALGLLTVITLINLRGVRETGIVMAIPVYSFLFSYLLMMAYGVYRLILEGPSTIAHVTLPATQPLTPFLVLHAFAAGCTALTGIEAISNGIPAFRPPQARNAGRTLGVMAVLMGILFLGSIGLTHALAVVAAPQETILSALARRLLGQALPYYIVQITTLLILTVAANTSFADFPRLSAILARDGFLPRQLFAVGDRLVYSNGILLLALATGGLIVIFQGNTHALIPLFAVGAFLAFTLSQSGMVLHWWRLRGKGWLIKMLANGVGALATLSTLLVVGVSKFLEGAWLTVLVILGLIYFFSLVRNHYRLVARQLTLKGLPPSLKPIQHPRAVIPISGVHRGIVDAVRFAQSIAREVTAVYVELEPGDGEKIRHEWEKWWPDVPLVVLPSPYRSIIGPLIRFLDEADRQHHDGEQAVVILPEFIPAKWWQAFMHNQTSIMIRAALLYRRRELGYQRVIIDVPYHLKV